MLRTLILLIFCAASLMAESAGRRAAVGAPYVIHGRLSVYCGTPSVRIWIVGTHRMLGVVESGDDFAPEMPAELLRLLQGEKMLFGDFTVEPLTEDKPGVMRTVRVLAAERLVLTDCELRFERRIPENHLKN